MAVNYEIKKETPVNIDAFVKMAGDKTSWRKRLEAVNELKKWDCEKSRDVLTRLALRDRVYRVKEEAFRAAQALGVTKNGKPIYLGKKDIGYNTSDFKKTFLRIKRECKLEKLDIQIFKNKFIQVQPEMYDVMLYEKENTSDAIYDVMPYENENKFDVWIENIYNSLPKK